MPGIVAYTSIISQCGVGQERVSLLLFSFTANRNRKSRRAARRQKKGTAAAGCCQSALTGRMGVTLRLNVTPAENQSVNGEDVCVCVRIYFGGRGEILPLSLSRQSESDSASGCRMTLQLLAKVKQNQSHLLSLSRNVQKSRRAIEDDI